MTLKKINNFIIRPIKNGDRQKIINLWHDCGLFKKGGLAAENEFTIASTLDNSKIFIAEQDDNIVAVVLGALSNKSGWIWDLAVKPNLQKQGIGKAMVRKAENWIKQQGGERSMLFMQYNSKSLQGFYNSLSYNNVTDNIMHKSL